MNARLKADPHTWIRVKDTAEIYLECRSDARLKRAERDFLWPLGLTKATFIEQQRIMDPSLVDRLARDMIQYRLPTMAVIIAGIDGGAHIYVIHNGQIGDNDIGCYDAMGFAAIGIGARHANAHFLSTGHKFDSLAHEALLATYVAKKRAEVAPGVGPTTDMYVIGPQLGSTAPG